MSKSLSDLLANKWEEPEEFKQIKEFVHKKYKTQISLKQTDKSIFIYAPSAALAGSLRMDINKLQEEIKSNKRLVIRIG